ncbi:amino acid ABC transporter substrate-binding protein [Alcaligenaceae bacterium]|nr:amino acid ABC transporter substrate-binding protein [Alcaligenaceae bacterium]
MKIITIAGVLAAAYFAAGGAPALAAGSAATLEKIRSTGEVSLGYRETAVPFSYLNNEHQPTGFSLDLCHEIVAALKDKLDKPDLKVVFQPVTASNRIPLLVNGSIDIECGSTTNTEERQKAVAFLYTTYLTGTKVLTRVDSGFKDLGDMKGKKIAVTIGTNNIKAVQRASTEEGLAFELVYGQDHAENFLQLKNRRVDGMSTDDILLSGLRADSGEPEAYTFTGPFLSTEPYAMMVRKDDPEFKSFADGVLKDLFQSGKFSEIYDKWFMKPVPPKNITFDIPMSPELAELVKNPSDKGA